MKILISDSIDQEGIDLLKAEKGFEVVEDHSLKGEKLAEAISPYDALITRSGTTVTAKTLEKAENLKVIGRAGVGVDNVDIEAASRKGIIVMNAPTGNTLAATEHTMAMMLAAVRKLPFAHFSLESGQWDRKKFMGIQLYKRTLGIVGLGLERFVFRFFSRRSCAPLEHYPTAVNGPIEAGGAVGHLEPALRNVVDGVVRAEG